MADAYKVKADVSLPRALREVEELVNGEKVYELEGRNYAAGQYVLARDITPPLREQAENGELEDLLEPVSLEEAQEALGYVERGTFIAEHEVEGRELARAGHTVVPREQVIEQLSVNSGEATEAMEAVKEEGADERPGLEAADRPSLAEVSRGEAENVNQGLDPVDIPEGLQQPPGVPVAATTEKEAKPRSKPRAKPQSTSAAAEKDKGE